MSRDCPKSDSALEAQFQLPQHVPQVESGDGDSASSQLQPRAELPAPWEEIEPGRFMPTRVRGSFVGRALG